LERGFLFFPSRWFEAGTVWKKQARRRSRVIQSESAVVRDVLVLGGRAGSPPYDIRRKDVVVV
jgi:hypothetical protein